jgi:type I restriction enzyme, R subunit
MSFAEGAGCARDWRQRETARARMCVLVKRILRKYGYPPDLQDAAVQTVLQQAEALSAAWARVG